MIQIKPQWKSLKGADDWLPELKKLLDEAHRAAQQAAIKPRLKVSEFLAGFIQESWPQTSQMDKLDDLAQQTVADLMLKTIDERLAAIASRTTEYVKLEKELNAAAERGEAAADSIRFKRIQNLIDVTTQVITSAKAVAAGLDDAKADEKKLAGLIEKTIGAVEKLRSEVAGLI